MKKIISFILAVCILLLTSSCNNTTIHNQSNSIPYQTNSIEISDDNEISEQEKTDYYVLNTRTKKSISPPAIMQRKLPKKIMPLLTICNPHLMKAIQNVKNATRNKSPYLSQKR